MDEKHALTASHIIGEQHAFIWDDLRYRRQISQWCGAMGSHLTWTNAHAKRVREAFKVLRRSELDSFIS